MEIEIPSPSVFLRKSPTLPETKPDPPTKKQPAKARGNTNSKNTSKASASITAPQNAGITKPKQSKSRNGCMTCKKKRLKCDETKPSCVQCQKRNVTCEGYKKDYKWRTFEETTQNSKAAKARKVVQQGPDSGAPLSFTEANVSSSHSSTSPQERPQRWSPSLHQAFASATNALTGPPSANHINATASPPHRSSHSQFDPLPIFDPSFSPSRFDLPSPPRYRRPSSLPPTQSDYQSRNEHKTRSQSPFSTGSPQLVDLLLPGTDLNRPPDPSEMRPPMSPLPYQPESPSFDADLDHVMQSQEEFDEEVIRDVQQESRHRPRSGQWQIRASSPAFSDTSSTSSRASDLTILQTPRLESSAPEMLLARFDQETCGILSVKDGPGENPWRTLIWPLARDSHALYHAISSMTAFHGSLKDPSLRVSGVAHMTKSIKKLSAEIENMRLDQALATSLALALSEGWDEKVSTGIQHLRGAKIMVNNALVKRNRDIQTGQMTKEDAFRLKFLCNTFIYLDVIARLTSPEEQDMNFEELIQTVNLPFSNQSFEVDPLMGCATTLFPIIGKIASLVQKVRRTDSNSLQIVSEAMNLKEELQRWEPPSMVIVERPEDPNFEVKDSLQTAEAYRYATLLYLHQAVPEIPIDNSHTLAHKILTLLAGVPLSSRNIIVQIFPLLIGSCEMVRDEDREWVTKRWEAMIRRLSIMNVTSCLKVVKEVWDRRDAFHQERLLEQEERTGSRGQRSPTSQVAPGYLVAPSLKRQISLPERMDEEAILNNNYGIDEAMFNDVGRPMMRRVQFNSGARSGQSSATMNFNPFASRRHIDMPSNGVLPAYTVRGHLHWLAVMKQWNWEVFLG